MVVCLHKFGARDSWLNHWEHRGGDMYRPRALLKLPGSGTTFFSPVKDTPGRLLRKMAAPDAQSEDVPMPISLSRRTRRLLAPTGLVHAAMPSFTANAG